MSLPSDSEHSVDSPDTRDIASILGAAAILAKCDVPELQALVSMRKKVSGMHHFLNWIVTDVLPLRDGTKKALMNISSGNVVLPMTQARRSPLRGSR